MTTYPLLPNPKFKETDSTGAPLVGGKLYTYDAGGPNTPKNTYDAAVGGSANQNPVILDSNGEADVYGSGTYYLALTDANDVPVWTADDVEGLSAGLGDETTAGLLQLATDAETIAGTLTTKATHPHGVKAASAFSILPVKTDMADDDLIAITDSTASDVNSVIAYSDLVTALALSGSTGITVPNGGTGVATLTDHGVLIGQGVDPIAVTGAGTAGQVLMSNGPSADPSFQSLPSGSTIQSVYSQNTTFTTVTGNIPYDDTIPQVSEGDQVLSASITPTSAANSIRIRAHLWGWKNTLNQGPTVALFVDGAANAIAAEGHAGGFAANYNSTLEMSLVHEYSPGDTSSHTYTIRVGAASGTLYLNGRNTGRKYGGVGKCTLILEEVSA